MNITDELDYLEGIMSDEYLTDQCTSCFEHFQESSLTRTHDDSGVCKECLEEFYLTCTSCESIVDFEDLEHRTICPVCGNVV